MLVPFFFFTNLDVQKYLQMLFSAMMRYDSCREYLFHFLFFRSRLPSPRWWPAVVVFCATSAVSAARTRKPCLITWATFWRTAASDWVSHESFTERAGDRQFPHFYFTFCLYVRERKRGRVNGNKKCWSSNYKVTIVFKIAKITAVVKLKIAFT